MEMKKKEEEMHLPTVDDFFTTQEERDLMKLEVIKEIPIKDISNFPNHPYKVKDDEEMQELANNIREQGLILPLLVRPKENGKFELISGHRRKRACEIAGISTIKAIVREMTDDEAIIQMVDSNKQREKVLPSEKAFAYKMRLDAMKRQAGRPKKDDIENSVPTAQNFKGRTSREILGEEVGESQDQVRRYIRLTELIPKLLQFVDEEQMKLRPAVEISYLTKDEQEYLHECIDYSQAFPSHPQARQMRKLSEQGKLTEDEIENILSAEKPNQKEQVKFTYDKVKDYFPKGYTIEQMQKKIEELLQQYQEKWKQKQKQYDR